MKTELPNFAQLINDLVSKAGWTQVRIAEAVGCSQVQVSRLQAGQQENPHASLAFPLVDLHKREMLNLKRRRKRAR